MYVYFHDVDLHNGKYFHIWNRVTARLNNLGIHGRKVKITALSNNLKAILQDEVKRGLHTVVAVGSDEMFLRLAKVVANFPKLVLAYIPFEQSYISKILGIAPQELACDILSSRIIYNFSLIKFNKDEYSLEPVFFDFDKLKIADSEVEWLVKGIEPGYKAMLCGDSRLWLNYYKKELGVEDILLAKDKINILIYKPGKKNWQKSDIDLSVLFGDSFFFKDKEAGKLIVPKSNYTKQLLQVRMDLDKLPVVVGKNRLLE